jgi:hypothetical protein
LCANHELCMDGRCKMEELADKNPDLSAADLQHIRQYYAEKKLLTQLPSKN